MGPSGYGVASHPAQRFGVRTPADPSRDRPRRIAPRPTSVHESGSHSERMPVPADLSPALSLGLGSLALVLIGALIGTAGYALTVGRRQTGRITDFIERLADSIDATDLVQSSGIDDPRLRASFGRLAERLTEAWTLATIDPLTGVLNRQALLARLDAELDRATRYGGQLSVDPRRPRPLQADQRLTRPRRRRCGPPRRRGGPRGQHPRSSTPSAATAARSSWSCSRRPTSTRRPRSPRSSAASSPAARSSSTTASPQGHPVGRCRRRDRCPPRAGAAHPRRRQRPVQRQGARPRPGLCLPRDRGRRAHPPGAIAAERARAGRRGRPGRLRGGDRDR